MHETWMNAMKKEFGAMAQGDEKLRQKSTNSNFVLNHEQIARIPKDRIIMYTRIVVDF